MSSYKMRRRSGALLVRFSAFYRFERRVSHLAASSSFRLLTVSAAAIPSSFTSPPCRRLAPSQQPRRLKLALLGKKLISSFSSLPRTLSCSLGAPHHKGLSHANCENPRVALLMDSSEYPNVKIRKYSIRCPVEKRTRMKFTLRYFRPHKE